MNVKLPSTTRLGVTVCASLALLLSVVLPTFAADTTSSVTVLGGGLSLTVASGPDFGSVSQSALPTGTMVGPVSVDLNVKDLRGTAGGWNLQITSTHFSTGGATPATLPDTATRVTTLPGTCVVLLACVPPAGLITGPLTVPAGSSPPAPVKFFQALPPTGMGDMTVSPAFTLTIPANSLAGTYTSTMTITIAAGP